jgi:hypothetical protein
MCTARWSCSAAGLPSVSADILAPASRLYQQAKTSNILPESTRRLREIAASLGITERSAYAIIIDLTEAGAKLAGVPRGAGRGAGRGRARPSDEGDERDNVIHGASCPRAWEGRGRRWAGGPG